MRRLLTALVLLVAALPAFGDEPEDGVHTSRDDARTLPLPRGDDVFHFVIYGDRTGGPAAGIKVLEQAVRETNLLDPDLVMTVGDLVQGYNKRKPWMTQMREYRGVMEQLSMAWFPVAGNHDIYWRGSTPPEGHHETDYERQFGPLWYWFKHKNAAFVVLFSDEGDPEANKKGWNNPKVNQMSQTQLDWLEDALTKTQALDHVFVFLHHPRWRADYYRGTNWSRVHALLNDAGNVSAVFAGHMHRQRYAGKKDGIEYFTLAATGGGMPFDAPGTGYLHHMDVVTVREDSFKVVTIPIGTVIDPKEMTPERITEINQLLALAPCSVGDPLSVQCDGGCAGQLVMRLENPTTRPIEVTLSLDSGDGEWWIRPHHVHATVEPGEDVRLRFRYTRIASDIEGLRAPGATLQTTWVGETMRVAIPERTTSMGVQLATLPDGIFTKPNAAVRLDGRRQTIRVTPDVLTIPDGPMTVEGWLKADSFKGRRAFLNKTEQSGYGIFVSDGTPSFLVSAGETYLSAKGAKGSLEAGRWHHIAGVYDGAQVRLYVDGRLVATTDGGGPRRRNPFPLYVGADPDRRGRPNSFFKGLIDEVRISVGARYEGSSFAPARRFEPDADTLLLLHLDEAVGPFVPDHSAGQRHAIAPVELSFESVEDRR